MWQLDGTESRVGTIQAAAAAGTAFFDLDDLGETETGAKPVRKRVWEADQVAL